ncbi:uncharacterized protein N7473_002834 [Penicillium subrubescens]|jgi:hypothetical protein|uniref:Uncharacterized protein n=1 Tax=Penicillium subrubescens TaxID=1316194 RepID=A0A1Q5TD77_9EURO|nr:uncharacterized protein N7473_002834 [Penicillium subrubescens]KAJ5905918.1 hypothetical protein N7473_002834 [Penicillium subrubescens]OKO98174.1 hypothetical protein PENSUB_9272 [Penicillium subrubescens]
MDAGGGTVDLITFTIEQTSPVIRLCEAAAGTRSYCGSTLLNRHFEDFLRSRLEAAPGWDSDTLEQAMSRFEAWAKRRFTDTETFKLYFPVPGIGDDQDLNVHRGFFSVTVEEMR